MTAEANLPAMWFHPDSYQPVTKCQNNGVKMSGHSLHQGLYN
jgi:hypothetical protein